MFYSLFRVHFSLAFASLLFACSSDGDKSPPPANSSPQWTSDRHVAVEENRRGHFFTLSATDADGDTLSFSLQGPDAALFELDQDSGALQFRQPPDFETPLDADGDNLYQLTAAVADFEGGAALQALTVEVTNVAFAYEFLSPLPDTIVELERYSRLPIAAWVEYDYAERLQILCDGEILNPASDSGMTWTGSIDLDNGRVMVECVFWRGEEAFETLHIPVRHQHVISEDRYLVYDGLNQQIMIPHPERLETLLIDATTGESAKRYPWIGVAPRLQDVVADTNNGGALYIADGAVQRLDASGNSVASVTGPLDSVIPAQAQSTVSYDSINNRLYASGTGSTYTQIDLANGATNDASYTGPLEKPVGSRVETAWDGTGNRLFFASGAATGVEVVTLDTDLVSGYGFSHPQRWGDMQYEPTRDQLFISAWSENQVLRLDLDTGAFVSLGGSGPALTAPRTLALDADRDRLLTISNAQLVALDPDTGDRSVLFDSAAGPGATTGGFAGIWVAADSTHALALDRHIGQFYRIDLRTGTKTAKTYTWSHHQEAAHTDPSAAPSPHNFAVVQGKFNGDGSVAAIHYRSRDLNAQASYLDLITLENGTAKRLAINGELVDFSFSRPQDQLSVLVRNDDQYAVEVYSLSHGVLWERTPLTIAADFTPLALQKIDETLYILGRAEENSLPVFRLSTTVDHQTITSIATFNEIGTGKSQGAGISTMYDDSVLALQLPEQSPIFWDRAAGEEYAMDFTNMHGTDQPKDFYTIDDYAELYFFRARAGLHMCWRFHCAVQAN